MWLKIWPGWENFIFNFWYFEEKFELGFWFHVKVRDQVWYHREREEGYLLSESRRLVYGVVTLGRGSRVCGLAFINPLTLSTSTTPKTHHPSVPFRSWVYIINRNIRNAVASIYLYFAPQILHAASLGLNISKRASIKATLLALPINLDTLTPFTPFHNLRS